MSLKKFGVALLTVFVLGAIAANSAFATNAFVGGGTWNVGGPKLKEGEANAKELTTKANGKTSLVTSIAGVRMDLTAPEISCLGCKIDNTAGTVATIDGVLSFTEVTVSEPAGCAVEGGKVETKPLTATLGMGGAGTKATLKFVPKEGTTFALVVLTGTSCPIAGTYKVTGTQFGEASNATGVFAETQEVKTSAAIQESAGEAGSLKFGANPAVLTGALKGTLTSKEKWGGEE
jgi:hypothetical protein